MSRRRMTLAVATIVLAALATSCGLTPPYEGATSDPSARKTVVIGDSLVDQSRAHLAVNFGEKGQKVSINGKPGADLASMRGYIGTAGDARPDAIVIALGTNDVGQLISGARTWDLEMAHIRDAMSDALSQSPCVVWVNINDTAAYYQLGTWGPHINSVIRAEANNRGVHLADWNLLYKANPSFIASDGLHLTWEGQIAYAELIRATSTQC